MTKSESARRALVAVQRTYTFPSREHCGKFCFSLPNAVSCDPVAGTAVIGVFGPTDEWIPQVDALAIELGGWVSNDPLTVG